MQSIIPFAHSKGIITSAGLRKIKFVLQSSTALFIPLENPKFSPGIKTFKFLYLLSSSILSFWFKEFSIIKKNISKPYLEIISTFFLIKSWLWCDKKAKVIIFWRAF